MLNQLWGPLELNIWACIIFVLVFLIDRLYDANLVVILLFWLFSFLILVCFRPLRPLLFLLLCFLIRIIILFCSIRDLFDNFKGSNRFLLELTVYRNLALAVTVDGDVETIIFKDFLSTLQGCVIINYLVRIFITVLIVVLWRTFTWTAQVEGVGWSNTILMSFEYRSYVENARNGIVYQGYLNVCRKMWYGVKFKSHAVAQRFYVLFCRNHLFKRDLHPFYVILHVYYSFRSVLYRFKIFWRPRWRS